MIRLQPPDQVLAVEIAVSVFLNAVRERMVERKFMSNDDVNAVILRLARTLQRCGEDTGVVFAALIGAAATVASDLGERADTPEGLKEAIDSVVSFGDLRAARFAAEKESAAVIPFRPARVA